MNKKHYAVIGCPIGHTMSPFIHKRLFELSGIEAEYIALEVKPENFERDYREALSRLDGYNVTIPHKRTVIPYLDEIDRRAELYGSVNTVFNSGGIAKGYTTDPYGFLKALEYADIPISGRVIVLGCGGAARTMAFEAALRGAEVVFAVREQSLSKAQALIEEMQSKLNGPKVACCNIGGLGGKITTLINATPVGMSPKSDAQPVGDSVLKNCENVFDAVYNPLETKLIKSAKAMGINAEGGMPMLVWQAARSHYYWDGSEYDRADIEKLCSDAAEEMKKR